MCVGLLLRHKQSATSHHQSDSPELLSCTWGFYSLCPNHLGNFNWFDFVQVFAATTAAVHLCVATMHEQRPSFHSIASHSSALVLFLLPARWGLI